MRPSPRDTSPVMASFSTTATLDEPQVSRGNEGGAPPIFGGGDDGRAGRGLPNYPTRLRRARLGLLVALTPVLMLFVSFTSAYVMRQGLPTWDTRTNQLVHDWIPVKLPALLWVNTLVLLTGAHAVHLMGGVVALLVAGLFVLLRRPVTTRSIVVDVAGWYWHFMAALWVYILCLLEFAR